MNNIFPLMVNDVRKTHTIKEFLLSQPTLFSAIIESMGGLVTYSLPSFFNQPSTILGITLLSLVLALIKITFNINSFGHNSNY